MGWGREPHEGWADEKLPDGRWLGGVRRSSDPDAVALQAVCSCGWRSQREHLLPPRPVDIERDEHGTPRDPRWEAWIGELEKADEACWEDWNAEHYEPLLGYEPDTQLILGRTEGGLRHFLGGLSVHAGARLEILLADGSWLAIRYEWNWQPDSEPTATFELGLPLGAERVTDPPQSSFKLPSRAILRWPQARDHQ